MKNQIVRPQYLLIGSGRTARHFKNYFQQLNLSFSTWDRSQSNSTLLSLVTEATHVLLLISDSAIEGFYKEHLAQSGKVVVHFSGALEVPGVISAHPLMTFSGDAYPLETYQKVSFVITSSRDFSEILPDLPNEHYRISVDQKALYHAFCVMSGNFTTLLWKKMSQGMKDLHLPEHIFRPYLQQIAANILTDSQGSLTGPIARRDLETVKKNDQALAGDPYQKIYRAFLEVYFPESIKELTP